MFLAMIKNRITNVVMELDETYVQIGKTGGAQ